MDLETLDALYEKATRGTRKVEYNPDDHHDGRPEPNWYVSWGDLDHDSTLMLEADARFMAEIHNSYPALRDRLRALEAALRQLIEDAEGVACYPSGAVGFDDLRATTDLAKGILAALDKEATNG